MVKDSEEQRVINASEIEVNVSGDLDDSILVPINNYKSRNRRSSFSQIIKIESEKHLPSIIIADEDSLSLNNLEEQVKKVIGPDNLWQLVTCTNDGEELLESY